MLPQWVNDAGTVTSLISFVISIFVAWKVSAIAKQYRQIGMAPRLLDELKSRSKNFKQAITNKNWTQVRTEAALIGVAAKQIKSITTGGTKASAVRVIQASDKLVNDVVTTFQHPPAEMLLVRLAELVGHLSTAIENQKWHPKT